MPSPRSPIEGKTRPLPVRLSEAEYAELERRAAEEHRSMSGQARHYIVGGLGGEASEATTVAEAA